MKNEVNDFRMLLLVVAQNGWGAIRRAVVTDDNFVRKVYLLLEHAINRSGNVIAVIVGDDGYAYFRDSRYPRKKG